MSLVAIGCGRGTRGVTTATLALAAAWPGVAVVAECDLAGGSLAARFGLTPSPGMLSLAAAARRPLASSEVLGHAQPLPVGLGAILGPPQAEQAQAVTQVWPAVAEALAGVDATVLADCGRLASPPATLGLLRRADLVLLLGEPTTDGLVQLRDRLRSLEGLGVAIAAATIGTAPYPPAEVSAWLAGERVRAPLLGHLADDPRAARLLGGASGPARGLQRSTLLRSATVLAERLTTRMAARREPSGTVTR